MGKDSIGLKKKHAYCLGWKKWKMAGGKMQKMCLSLFEMKEVIRGKCGFEKI